MEAHAFEPSQDLIAAARAELERLRELAASLRQRRQRLARELEDVDQQRRDLTRQMRRLGDVIGLDPNTVGHSDAGDPDEPETVDGRQVLRGARIREVAIRVLLERPDPSADIHYREWVALIERAGFQIAGRDPGAVLLTQVSRSPLVVRAPDAGCYRLDNQAMSRLKMHHMQIEAGMRAVANESDGVRSAAQLSGELNRLSAEDRRLRRQMEELVQTVNKVGAHAFFGLEERTADETLVVDLRVA